MAVMLGRGCGSKLRGVSNLSHLLCQRPRHFAQPTPATHPHLMQPGEVTPGISSAEYVDRRQKLAESLPEGSLALFASTPIAYMSHDVPYFPHHQDTDLLYLCGLQEHSSILACVKPAAASGSAARWHLFVRPSDAREELWDGARAGVQGAQSFFLPEGAAHKLSEAPSVLQSELRGGGLINLFYEPSSNRELEAKLRPALRSSDGASLRTAQPARRLVHALRVRKTPAEVELMRDSGRIGSAAMRATMAASMDATRSGMTEAALAATFEFQIRAVGGAERLAYPSVVAGGTNATTLHYMHNNAPLRQGELLLMDAGASFHGYCSDVTRTWPLGGTFSPAQTALYNAVLDVNERIISHIGVLDSNGARPSLNALHSLSLQWPFEHLVDLGIVSRDDPQAAVRVQRYYPHAIGHYLGLDVHDTPSVDSGQRLVGGMVVTVEPGLYIPMDDMSAPPHFRGIGIRIEDDVLVPHAASQLAEVLSSHAPKRVADVEEMLALAAAGEREAGAAAAAAAL